MAEHSRGHKRIKRLQLAMEEEELRSLRIPSSAYRGNLSPSKNAILPTLQENTQDHTMSSRSHHRTALDRPDREHTSRDGAGGTRAENVAAGGSDMDALLSHYVLTHISAEWLESVKQDFMAFGGSLNLVQFLSTMLRSLEAVGGATGSMAGDCPQAHRRSCDEYGADDEDAVGRTAAITDLFRRADVHSEGEITWDEVSNFLIEHGDKSGMDSFQVDKIKQYTPSIVPDLTKHDQHVEKLVYLEQLDVVACLSHRSRGFRLYDPHRCTVKQEVQGNWGHKGALVNCCYVDGLGQIATTSADMTICMWDSASLGLRNRMTAKDVQLSLCGSAAMDSLFSGAIDGTLSRWDTSNMCLSETRKGQHKDAINDLLMIEDINLLASASSDGSTIMWDLETMRPKKHFKGHRKGTFSLAYSSDYRCLLTSGLEQEALVWNPYVERVPIFRLKGHTNALCGVAVMPGTPQIISADVKGTFRLWDMRNFRPLQSFGGKESRLTSLSTFCVMPPHKRIVAGSGVLTMFDYMEDWDGDVTEVGGLTEALYNPRIGEFLTLNKHHARAWNAGTGVVFKVLPYVENMDITACCIGDNGRKFYLGCSNGRVSCHSINNGAFLSDLEPHKKDVSCLDVWAGTNKVFTASWDGILKVHADEPGRKPYVKADFAHHRDSITCLACSGALGLMASGGNDAQVCIYDLRTLKLEHNITRFLHSISSLGFIDEYHILGVADHGGFVSLWRTRPHRWEQVYHFTSVVHSPRLNPSLRECGSFIFSTNSDQENQSVPLTSVCFAVVTSETLFSDGSVPSKQKVPVAFTSDAKGVLRRWDLSPILDGSNDDVCLSLGQSSRRLQPAATLKPVQHGPLLDSVDGTFCTGLDEDLASTVHVPTTVRSAVLGAVRNSTRVSAICLEGTGNDVESLSQAAMGLTSKDVEAHVDGVIRLHLTSNPTTLISVGYDSKARLWDMDLNPLGSLLQQRDPVFEFPFDSASYQASRLAEARTLLKDARLAVSRVPKTYPRTPNLPSLAHGATQSSQGPKGMLASLCSGRRTKPGSSDADRRCTAAVSRVMSDNNVETIDYQMLFEEIGQLGRILGSAPYNAVSERLSKQAHQRQSDYTPLRCKALSKEEAAAADRLATAMAAVGGDDAGSFATMAKTIRPKIQIRMPLTAR